MVESMTVVGELSIEEKKEREREAGRRKGPKEGGSRIIHNASETTAKGIFITLKAWLEKRADLIEVLYICVVVSFSGAPFLKTSGARLDVMACTTGDL